MDNKTLKKGICEGNYRVDRGGIIHLTRKRKAQIRRSVEETLKQERVKIANHPDSFLFSVWLKKRKRLDLVLGLSKMGQEYKGIGHQELEREFSIDACTIYRAILSQLPDETQWELTKHLQERFNKNKKLKLRIMLRSKFHSK